MTSKNSKSTTFQSDVNRIAKLLQKEIYAGIRLPNEHLTESKLSETYSVNRMTIRQVLSQLAAEGVVELEPYKGATVAAVTIDQVVETYQVVALLEGYSASLATPKVTVDDIRRLKQILEKQKKVKEGDPKSWQSLNHVFHRIINKRCTNKKVIKLLRHNAQFTRYWFLTLANTDLNSAIKAHQKIIEALEERNAENVRKYMESHIINVVQRLVEHIKENVPIGMFRSV